MFRTVSALLLILLAGRGSDAAPAPPSSAFARLPSGVSLHYVVQGAADGQPIVLLHGVGDSWHTWDLVLPHLPERYRVYALSLRGHGLSDAPETGYTQKDLAADVTAFLDLLALDRVILVGHSLGSFAAQAVAAGDRGRLAALVLVGSGPGGSPRSEVAKEVVQAFDGMASDPRQARHFQGGMTARPIPAPFFETMVAATERVPPHVWRQVGAAVYSPETAASLASISVPTLLIWGDQDALLGRADQDALLARIAGSRLLVYPGTGHCPNWEWPDRFARDLVEFVETGAKTRESATAPTPRRALPAGRTSGSSPSPSSAVRR